jgi:hypothetical protein
VTGQRHRRVSLRLAIQAKNKPFLVNCHLWAHSFTCAFTDLVNVWAQGHPPWAHTFMNSFDSITHIWAQALYLALRFRSGSYHSADDDVHCLSCALHSTRSTFACSMKPGRSNVRVEWRDKGSGGAEARFQ